MALNLADRVRETTTVTGTGPATLLGAVTGYQSFSVIGNGNTTYYTIADQGGPNWEVGLGTWSTGGTLARTTVLASSNSGSLVNFTTGTKDVFVTYPSEEAIYNNGTSIVGPTGSSVAVANGGTGATTLAANGVIYGNGTGAVGVTAVGTTGQVLVGNTGAAPSFAALSSSAVTSITGTANQITASASTGAVTLSLPSSVTTGQYIANQSISGSATQGAFAYGTLNGSDTGIFASYQTSIAGYAYMALQNTSSNAAATTDIALYNDTASLGKYIDIGINSSAFTGTGNFSLANAGYIYTNGGDLTLGTYSANGIHFIVNNGATDAMYIDTSGNVGIGTASPATKLEVSSTNNIIKSTGTGGYGSFSAMGSGTNPSYMFFGSNGTETGRITTFNTGDFTIGNGSGATERMRIDSSGNVGIGTSSPSSFAGYTIVDIYNGTTGAYTFVRNSTKTGQFGVDTNGVRAGSRTNDFFTLVTNDTERMRITSAGNVGINTTSPAGKLHINTGTNQNVFFTNGTGYAGANGVSLASVNDANSGYQQLVIASSQFVVNASGGTGYMGIATNSPQGYLDIAVGSQTYNPTYTGHLRLPGTGNPAVTNNGGLEFIASSYQSGFGFRITACDETGGSTPLQFFYRANTATWTEGMRFTNAGSLLIGTTSNPTNGCLNLAKSAYIGTSYYNFASTDFALTVAYGTTIPSGISFGTNATSGTQTAARFFQNGSTVGTIQTTNTATAFNTSSDYRLKENIQPLTNALNTIAKLKPVIYKWKSDGSDGEGFIAHELAEVCPLAVSGEKDAVDSDGNIKPQGIDTSKLIATLTAAIQEQQQLINDLTARTAKLEGK